jgi:spermidine synthase
MSYEDFRVTGHIQPGAADEWSIETFEVTERASRLYSATNPRERVRSGSYTKLSHLVSHERGVWTNLWMSDTRDEYLDHWEAIRQARGRVLVNGLGLGCFLRAILLKPEVEHVDVVEISGTLVEFMRAHAPWLNDPRITVHVADAYEQTRAWPKGTRWDVAWHDIWAYICEDNAEGYAKLNRSYGRRVEWQGCWAQEKVQHMKRQSRHYSWV